MSQRLLLVEDERKLREQLIDLLSRHGYTVDAAEDGIEGLFLGQKYDYDISVIDLGLPHIPGAEVIERLRADGREYPILILTARGDWKDKVDGLGRGADDYLVKPFHVQEFLARLEALTRRASGGIKAQLDFGLVFMDTRGKRVLVGEELVELTAYEFNLLEYLMRRPGEVVSKTALTEHLYDQDFDRDSNVIEVFVGRLRRKLDPANELRPIETVRGQGYRFSLRA
ncbi:MAG: DNA-binding response regulator [Gammaproteobacteria bacterium]|nr:DNA-binding response regulator [Gammaproteobacteria bacterium]|tara:strand:+ start:1067 stop:1747 length:681 start_codon:yes stop_codon:yes gene_type:complete